MRIKYYFLFCCRWLFLFITLRYRVHSECIYVNCECFHTHRKCTGKKLKKKMKAKGRTIVDCYKKENKEEGKNIYTHEMWDKKCVWNGKERKKKLSTKKNRKKEHGSSSSLLTQIPSTHAPTQVHKQHTHTYLYTGYMCATSTLYPNESAATDKSSLWIWNVRKIVMVAMKW